MLEGGILPITPCGRNNCYMSLYVFEGGEGSTWMKNKNDWTLGSKTEAVASDLANFQREPGQTTVVPFFLN